MEVEFHFDFGSPNAYLSHLVIPGIEQRTGVAVTYVPTLLGGIFKATNNVSPAISMNGIKNKGSYQAIETKRFLQKHNITKFESNPFFPVNTLQIMRGAVFAQREGFLAQYVNDVYTHMWSEPKKMDDIEVIKSAFDESGLPAEEIIAGMQDPEVKKGLIANTERSVEMGSFGSPMFYVNGEPYFGKDNLRDWEERILELLG